MARDLLENKAFEELFDLHYGNLVGFVYGYVRDEEIPSNCPVGSSNVWLLPVP